MEIKAKGKFLRISPKKMRLVVDLIRGMKVSEAFDSLKFVPRKASTFIGKVLKSAQANAEHNFNLEKNNLFIKNIFVNEGPALKRWQPKAYGRATPIKKRSSHLEIILDEVVPSKKDKNKKEKTEISAKELVLEKEVKKEEVKKEPPKIQDKSRFRARSGWRKTEEKGAIRRIFRRKAI